MIIPFVHHAELEPMMTAIASALDRSTEKNLSPPICIDLDRSSSSVDTFMDSDSEGGPIR